MATNYISDEERDQRLGELLKQAENKVCFDWKRKNPKWASSTIGIFIWYDWTTKHRQMGTHISFWRSISMDKWKAKEIRIMELGGNKKAHAFYTKNGMFVDGRPNHENPTLTKYKSALAKQALAEIDNQPSSKTNNTQEEPISTPVEEDKKEEIFLENIKETPPVVSKIPSSDTQTSSSIYSFSNFKQPNQPANLNAK